jgi:uncharacterized iron-regulated membrane protein
MIFSRNTWVLIHRYAGLFILLFVFQVGFTGTLLAFNKELDHLFLGDWATVTPTGNMQHRDTLIAAAEAAFPGIIITGGAEDMASHPRDSALFYAESTTDTPPPVTEVFVNPYTAQVLGGRYWGAITLDAAHFMPMMYRMHYALLLQDWDGWGFWFMGIVAVIWAIDHIGVLFISFPKKGPLWKAFAIKWTGSAYRVNVDIHRAGGLVFWVILLMLAVTGLSWNGTFFGTNIIHAPLTAISPALPYPLDILPELETPLTNPVISSETAMAHLRTQLAAAGYDAADVQHWGVYYDAYKGAYGGYAQLGNFGTQYYEIAVDGATGQVRATLDPKDYTAGNIIANWMYPLHSGQAFGLFGRILICAAGIFTCTVCVTGFVIYLKKLNARRQQASRRRTEARAPIAAE